MKIKRRVLFFIFWLLSVFFNIRGADLRNGDLIFTGNGKSDFSAAIISATGDSALITFTHVAIITIGEKNDTTVIEASPQHGVREIAMKDFLLQAPRGEDGSPLVAVKRVTVDFDVDKTVEKARQLLGRPYDWLFQPGASELYCSELVYECYLFPDGSHIFQSAPMNFKDSDGEFSDFWLQLFSERSREIPQDVPGTNPNDISKSPLLMDVGYDCISR